MNVILLERTNKEVLTKIEKILRDVTKGLMRISIQECQKIWVEENGKFKVVKNLVQEEISN